MRSRWIGSLATRADGLGAGRCCVETIDSNCFRQFRRDFGESEEVALNNGLSKLREQSEAPVERMDTLVQNTEPNSPGLVKSTIDPLPVGITAIRPSQEVALDHGLSRQRGQSQAPEEKMDTLVQTTEPNNPRLVKATIDPLHVGSTSIGPSQEDFSESDGVSLDQGLSRQHEQSEAPEERMDTLVQTTEPNSPRLVEATIDPLPVGRTAIGPRKGEEKREENVSFKLDDHPEADCAAVFAAVMRQRDVQLPDPLLIISKEHALAAAAHFPRENGTITLQTPGKIDNWQPRFFIEKDKWILAGNWLDFVCDNDLHEGDICIFVPEKGRARSTFMVHLIRSESADPRGVKMVSLTHGTTDGRAISAVSMEWPSHGGKAPLESNIQGVSHGSPTGKARHGPSKHRSFFLPRFTKLTTLQKDIVDKRVQARRSKYPLYVGIIVKGCFRKDGSHRQFEFSQGYARAVHLPSRRSQTMILQSMGNKWSTRMRFRKYNNIATWIVVNGWDKFAQDTGLCYGDMCIFELKSMNEEEITMEVHVIPKWKF